MAAPRTVRDLGWAVTGVVGVFAAGKAIEALRPPVIDDDPVARENDPFVGELTRASAISAAAIVLSPLLGAARLPALSGPLGVGLQLGGLALRVRAMRTLRGHYAHTVRVAEAQPVIRNGPYRVVRHPGYLSALLISLGGALAARNAVAPALTLTAVGTAYRHRMDAEETLLRRELPGYAEYAAATPRLLPRPTSLPTAIRARWTTPEHPA